MSLNLEELFEKHSEKEFLKFKSINEPLHVRRDICAFMLLHNLAPKNSGHVIISSAEHDEIFLNVDLEILAKNATENDIVTLIRCGVRLDTTYECLAMFV